MQTSNTTTPDRYRAYTRANIERMPQWSLLDEETREAVLTVSLVLPFRTNAYVCDRLIDWDRVPDDPIFRLTFPQRGMLESDHYDRLVALSREVDRFPSRRDRLEAEIAAIRSGLNPHPACQTTHNVPLLHGRRIPGVQHKYRETVLFFPSAGQTCHAFCTFCFRWPQFVGDDDLKFASAESETLAAYLRAHPRVHDVLLTGGDPMIMKTRVLARYLEPLLEVESVRTIRIGTKAIAYWPQRFVTDADADDLMRLFEQVTARGKHLAVMAHASHAVEFSTRVSREAVRRIRATGAVIRLQSPVLRHINDDAGVWVDLWTEGTRLGCVPYYMFVERDTGARRYFEMPLVRCWNIFRNAYQQVPGTARTVRGPSMSCHPGKCHILGVAEVGGEQAFVLEFLQAREPDMVRRPFFARYDPHATWYDDLEPLGASDEPFFLKPDGVTTPVRLSVERGGVWRSGAPDAGRHRSN